MINNDILTNRYNELYLTKELGSGAFGVVLKGTYRGKDIAVKKPKGEITESQLNEIMKEAFLMQSVPPHPNVLKFIGVCMSPLCIGKLYCFTTQGIVMDFAESGSLITLLQSTIMPIDSKLVIVAGIIRGMAHLRIFQ